MTSPSPSELAAQLKKLGFRVLPDQLEDFLGRAKKGRWSTRSGLAYSGETGHPFRGKWPPGRSEASLGIS